MGKHISSVLVGFMRHLVMHRHVFLSSITSLINEGNNPEINTGWLLEGTSAHSSDQVNISHIRFDYPDSSKFLFRFVNLVNISQNFSWFRLTYITVGIRELGTLKFENLASIKVSTSLIVGSRYLSLRESSEWSLQAVSSFR